MQGWNLLTERGRIRSCIIQSVATIDGVTTTYCYDYADRLVSSSDPSANGATYDSHGNTTQIGTGTTPLRLTYNSLDANTALVSYDASGNGSGMYYARDASGRIVYREHDTIASSVWTLDTAQFYGFTGPGDSPDFVRDGNWNITDKYLQLPGGVMVDIRPQQSGNTAKQYTLPSIEGRTLLTTDASGTNTSAGSGPLNSFAYDPFGNAIGSLPSNAQNGSYGFGGSLQKMTETTVALAPIQMGARVYFPSLGRFAQVDPVDGGTANRYVYVLDPVNGGDYSGMFGWSDIVSAVQTVVHAAVSGARTAVRVVTIVAKAIFNPTPTKSTTPYSGGANLPTGAGGKVAFKKMRVASGAKLGKHVKTYSSLSVGGNLYGGADYSIVQAEDGTMYHSISKGFALIPGADLSTTGGFGDPSLGCSISFGAFLGVGGSMSFSRSGLSFEVGLGEPGLSVMQVCTYRGLDAKGIL